jgi:maleylacetate reductase
VAEEFTWRDGERTIRFGAGVAAPELLAEHGFEDYALLTTERAAAMAPAVAEAAAEVHHVPHGKVDEVSAALLPEVGERPLVALGGGRVVDVAKAIAGVRPGGRGGSPSATDPLPADRSAAIPTTLSGAEMTPFHRKPAGVDGTRLTRPALVVADPELMASAPAPRLAATAMNALAHALEALYTPLRNPVADMAALHAAELIAATLPRDPVARTGLALGALLAGYASGLTGIAVHHALCQTIVRTAGTPHAETNAVMLPHSIRMMAPRAPGELADFAQALGDPEGSPRGGAGLASKLAARSGHTRLSTLGVEKDQLDGIAAAAAEHPLLGNTPDPPGEDELVRVLNLAL